MSVREMILASAGSGKTFRISSRIIGLLAAGEEPGSVFASTFTRKAAGEILDRVLIRMAKAALSDDEARELSQHAALGPDPPLPPDPVFWRGVLHDTVRELHRLDIATLDAFFVRAVNSFAFDLGLPPGWGIADEPTADRLRSEALDEVLDHEDRGAILELLRGLHAGDARRAVHRLVAREVDGILDVHRALDPDGPGWGALREAVGDGPKDVEDRCRVLAERIEAAPIPLTKTGQPDSRWAKARTGAAERVRSGDWHSYVKGGLYGKLLAETADQPAEYYNRPVDGELRELLEEAGTLARAEVARQLAVRAEAMGRLAEQYEASFGRRLVETGQLAFDDVTRFLTDRTPLGERADLFYRLDGATRHILLDEFQDTSLLQWRALVPLTDRLIGDAAEGAAVVVADPKQSIYGWRGAAPVVVEAVSERYPLGEDRMTRSWRSSPVVLEAVNKVFADIHRVAAVVDKGDGVDEVTAQWLESFDEHEAVYHDRPGYALLQAGPAAEGGRALQPGLCRFAAARIAELVERHPGHSIGVLTRKNETVARMIFELGRLGVAASEEGGTRLTDSAAVVGVLALLRLVDHPGNGLARYHVARTPVGAAVGYTDPAHLEGAGRLGRRVCRDLLEDGYGSTLAALATELREACDVRERARLRQLVELGYRWDAGAGSARVDDFVRLALATRAESPGEEPVRVMTVHRSKGLEFDIVVLPELHPPLFSSSGLDQPPLAYRAHPNAPVTHAYPPINKDLLPLFHDVPELQEARRQLQAGRVRDDLGQLYVAMTRARHALHMYVPADRDGKPSESRSAARILRETLSPGAEERGIVEGTVLYEDGDPDWSRRVEAPRRRQGRTPKGDHDSITLAGGPRSRVLRRRSPSSEEGSDAAVDLSLVLGLRGGRGLTRGTVVHAWLEQVEWIEDGLPEEESLLGIAAAHAPEMSRDEVRLALDWLRDRLEVPEIRDTLSRAHWPEGASIENELAFLVRDGEVLVEGFVDRLVLLHDAEGRVTGAEVLDYKTDAIDAEDSEALAARVAFYAPQIEAYRRAVAGLFGLEMDAVSGRLLMLGPGVVRRV